MHSAQQLTYKANASDVADRLALLWSRQGQDRIFAHFPISTRAMADFASSHADGPTQCPDPNEIADLWDAHFSELAAIEDDALPYGYPNEFDEGIYPAAAFGTQMQYSMMASQGRISSMAPPAIEDMAAVASLRFCPDSEALRLLDRHLKVYSERAGGRFGISPFIVIDAMNFVVEVRGATRAYTDTFDYPDQVGQLMDFALELNVFLQNRVLDAVESYKGGSFTLTGSWAPGRIVSFSVDAYHLASPEFYCRWGEHHLQKLLDRFDGGALHLHGNGRHLLGHVVKLRKLLCIHMGQEPWTVPAYDMLPELRRQAGDTPLIVSCGLERFENDLNSHSLQGNVLYLVGGAGSVDRANRLAEKVRAYRC